MFLHSGASLHGHEYSARPPPGNPGPGNRRSPLLRSSLAAPIPRPNSVAEQAKPPLRQQRRRLSENGARATPEPVVRFQEPEPARPKPEPMSEDEASYSASELSYLSDSTSAAPRPQRRRRVARKSTTYLFCHPAPKPRSKKQLSIHVRPKLLLQLQQLSADKRPRPAIDVFPSSLIAGNVVAPRFSKRFPRLFGVKGELGLHDVILVKSEDYDAHHSDIDSEGDEEDLEKRELVAVLSPLKREDRAEIVLEDGAVWVATPLANGSFDLVHTDEHGNSTTARWVRRSVANPPDTPSSEPGSPRSPTPLNGGPVSKHKFTFSVIDPQSRRHPIMGTLTSSSLEILDNYTTVSQSSRRYPPSKPLGRSLTSASARVMDPSPTVTPAPASPLARKPDGEGNASDSLPPATASPAKDRTTYPVEDALKTLMSVTAVWVSLKQGWAPNYKPPMLSSEPASLGAVALATNPNGMVLPRGTRSPRSEETVTAESSLGRSSPVEAAEVASSRPLTLRKGQTLPIQPKDREQSPAPSLNTLRIGALPRRATSTGAAFIQRRMQTQVSDASDSEKMTSGRRGKGRRVLSGDFGRRVLATPPLTTDVSSLSREETPSPAVELELATPVPTRPAVLARARQTHSAYYPDPPADTEDGGAPVGGFSGHDYVTEDEYANGGGAARADRSAKWRRFSNWFRRLGGGGR